MITKIARMSCLGLLLGMSTLSAQPAPPGPSPDPDQAKIVTEDLDRFCKAGLLELDGDLIRLTRTGALLSNEVFAAFV